jgi:hypothetical protein
MELRISEGDLAALDGRTEGWIAALQLAALSMQGRDDVSAFIAGFAGDDRYVVDYLGEEVLARQPAAVREFLLRTSILEQRADRRRAVDVQLVRMAHRQQRPAWCSASVRRTPWMGCSRVPGSGHSSGNRASCTSGSPALQRNQRPSPELNAREHTRCAARPSPRHGAAQHMTQPQFHCGGLEDGFAWFGAVVGGVVELPSPAKLAREAYGELRLPAPRPGRSPDLRLPDGRERQEVRWGLAFTALGVLLPLALSPLAATPVPRPITAVAAVLGLAVSAFGMARVNQVRLRHNARRFRKESALDIQEATGSDPHATPGVHPDAGERQ